VIRSLPALASFLLIGTAAAFAAAPEPNGFRMDEYRATVPATVAGGSVVHAQEIRKLQGQHGVVLIDVYPAPRRPPGTQPGTPWLPPVHRNLPDSLWWPEVGRGAIPPALETRFQQRLSEVTASQPGKLLVFYCKADCWLSWNATKRAASYGFKVAWFPEGADGWQASGLPTQAAKPESLD